MISDEDKQRACMMLYSALAQGKVDFSTGKVQYQLTAEQLSYLKALLFVFGMPGCARDQVRTRTRDFSLDQAARICKANRPLDSWNDVDQRVANEYGIKKSRVKKARATMRRFYSATGHPPQFEAGSFGLEAVQLSAVDFEAISDLLPQLDR